MGYSDVLVKFSLGFGLKASKNNDHTCLFHCITHCLVPQEMFEHLAKWSQLGLMFKQLCWDLANIFKMHETTCVIIYTGFDN